MENARIRLGMVGGGKGSLFGEPHRMAARLDDKFLLVAGAFSSDPCNTRASAEYFRVEKDRSYADFTQMARQESRRSDGIDAVAIVTPNASHFPIAKAFIEAGIHVMCEKPIAISLSEAEELQSLCRQHSTIFAVAHTYSGFGLVREARKRILDGDLGDIRRVQVDYLQDWLAEDLESTGHKQAQWRTNPTISGPAGCLADIGTHASHLVEYITGQSIEAVRAEVSTFLDGRLVDDDANILLRLSGGAKGHIWASQVAIGHSNDLRIRIYGDKGSLIWSIEEPNLLRLSKFGQPQQLISRGSSATSVAGRMPAGCPEGLVEALAQLYLGFGNEFLMLRKDGASSEPRPEFPTVSDGVQGMRFVFAALKSGEKDGAWVAL